MNLEEVLTFIRNANEEVWSLIIREVGATRTQSLLPLYMVEKALNLKSLQVASGI
jgi:hypothetical protein